MATEQEKLELLTLLSERRVGQLHLEAPELLDAGAELAELGFIRCGGGIPVRDDNGKVTTILNAEITAVGRDYLEASTRQNRFLLWFWNRKSLLAMALGLALLLVWLCSLLWDRFAHQKTDPPQEQEIELKE